jgi:hypothetical protein
MDLVAFDFQRILHLDLGDQLPARSWRWFTNHVAGILSDPSSLTAAHFHHEDDEETPDE